VAPFVSYWEKIHARTARVIDAIPRDRFEWRPVEGSFSFADLIRHLAAIERYMFAENAHGRWSSYPGHGPELADGTDGVLDLYRTLHAQAVALISELHDSDLVLPCTTPGGATMSRAKWLRAMIEHEVHHRGQIYLMLKLIGVATPPLYGLTSEQVLEKSRSAQP
jgi:uncharacterized damage-inducible protein DinB